MSLLSLFNRGGMVHRCHGSVRTSVQGSWFDTISVQHEKKLIYYAQFLFIYFEQTVVCVTVGIRCSSAGGSQTVLHRCGRPLMDWG